GPGSEEGLFGLEEGAGGLSLGGEVDDPLVPGVGDPDVSLWVHGEAARLVQLPVSRPLRSELAEELAVAVEDLDPAVLRVRDVEVSARVRREAAGLRELARARPGTAPHLRRG